MKSETTFPLVELKELVIPWEKCFCVNVGPVDRNVVRTMESYRYDFAPVIDQRSPNNVLGLISRDRLHELNCKSLSLNSKEKAITRPELQDRIRMDALLDIMKTTLATIVVRRSTRGRKALGLFTRADLNRHPFRAEVYFSLAHLEGEIAKIVRRTFADPWEWLDRLNYEKQARIVGYWEISKRRGVDNGPVGAATLSDLLNIAAKSDILRKILGYDTRGSFEKAVGRIPELRNQIMHPVRPLIVEEESISKLQADLETVFDMLQRLRKANKELRTLTFKGSSN
jgi:hypothetical protein